MAREQRDRRRQDSDLQERVVYIHRVSKTVKGGRRMTLVALVVVGDGKGNVGLGQGRSTEVPLAISKGVEDAKKQLIRPAIPGTGVIAGGPVRPLFEAAGITNVIAKSLGTDNALNIIKAAAEGLKELSSVEESAERRGLSVKEMFVGKEA